MKVGFELICRISGLIRFWPSVAHESTFSEVSADLQGQECFSLTDIQPVGSVLATTTSTVSLIFPTGINTVGCRMLKTPQGLLGGIGRRVSSMFWGSMNNGTEAVRNLNFQCSRIIGMKFINVSEIGSSSSTDLQGRC